MSLFRSIDLCLETSKALTMFQGFLYPTNVLYSMTERTAPPPFQSCEGYFPGKA